MEPVDKIDKIHTWEKVSLEEEYRRNPEMNKEEIKELMRWMSSQPDLPVASEAEVIRFHHSCYFNIEATKKCIKQFYYLRFSTPQLFVGRDINLENVKTQMDVVQFGTLPVKDPNGYQIILHRLQQFEPSKYVFNDSAKILCMAVEASVLKQGTIPGYIILFDMKGVRLGHLLRLPVNTLKKFFQHVQEACPVRLKAIHVVNTLPIIDKIMFMIRPFLKRELLKLIHFHSNDYEEVQKFIPKHCLPSDFGGDLPSIAEIHDDFKKDMQEMNNDFSEQEIYLENQMKKDLRKSLTELNKNSPNLQRLQID